MNVSIMLNWVGPSGPENTEWSIELGKEGAWCSHPCAGDKQHLLIPTSARIKKNKMCKKEKERGMEGGKEGRQACIVNLERLEDH